MNTATIVNDQGEQWIVNTETGEYVSGPTQQQSGRGPGAALATKVALVMASVGSVPKNGWNEHAKYRYATESDITDIARRAMANHNLALLPLKVEVPHVTEGKTARGNVSYMVSIRVHYRLIDGDSGESCDIEVVGTGMDTGEKAIYKAYTGAKKYALLQLFLLSTGDDDVERDSIQNTAPEQPQQQPQQQAAEPKPSEQYEMSTEQQHKSIYISADKAGLDDVDVKRDWLGGVYGVESAKDLTRDQARELIQFMYLLPIAKQLDVTFLASVVEDARQRAYDRKLLDRPKRWIDKKLAEADRRIADAASDETTPQQGDQTDG